MSSAVESKLLNALFPHKCPFCGAVLGGPPDGICEKCLKEISFCDAPSAGKKLYYDGAFSVFEYKGRVRSALLAYKFSGKRALGRFFGAITAKRFERTGLKADLIVCPPSLSKRKRSVGYDHARLLARFLSLYSGIPFKNVFVKTAKRRPMYELSSAERRANIAGSARVADPDAVRGKSILIADDIITTGATANECARLLRVCGAEKIYVIAAAARK